MRNLRLNIIFITALLISSCSKPDEVVTNVPHPLEQFIGKWVPVELIVDGQSNFGPFAFNTFFGAYKDSFEVPDTSGIYYAANYSEDSIGNLSFNRTLDKGKIIIDEKIKLLSFVSEDIIMDPSNFEFKSDKELWLIYTNLNRILKLKKK